MNTSIIDGVVNTSIINQDFVGTPENGGFTAELNAENFFNMPNGGDELELPAED